MNLGTVRSIFTVIDFLVCYMAAFVYVCSMDVSVGFLATVYPILTLSSTRVAKVPNLALKALKRVFSTIFRLFADTGTNVDRICIYFVSSWFIITDFCLHVVRRAIILKSLIVRITELAD